MRPRRAQTPVNFRSDKAAAILARHVKPGRSQALVIESALEKLDEGVNDSEILALMNRVRDIQARAAQTPRRFASMAEFDAHEYDERGNPR